MINEVFILQILISIILFYFTTTTNILILWYLAGIYLFSLGFLLLLDDGDIFIGFLWIIDLGVGLIFFIFILHFSNFLYQKTLFNLSFKSVLLYVYIWMYMLIFFYFLATSVNYNFNYELQKIWFLLLSWYDYYDFFFLRTITDLNLLREIYFYTNSLEFFIINFAIFYGILTAIFLTFLIKKIFNFLITSQFNNFNLLNEINSNLFIRNQNFIKQQNTSAGTRVWLKKKNYNI